MHELNQMNVLGIVGSPRRNGNTEILVDEILSGAAEAGAQIGKVILDELDISPCKTCNACKGGLQLHKTSPNLDISQIRIRINL